MFLAILEVLEVGLSLWLSKEKTKYQDLAFKLKREYWDEINKPAEKRSDAVLDNLLFELRLIASAFSADVRKQNPENKSPSSGV